MRCRHASPSQSVLPDLIRTEAPHLGAAHDPYHTAPGLPPGPIPVTCPGRPHPPVIRTQRNLVDAFCRYPTPG